MKEETPKADRMPLVVKALGEQVHMTPLAWWVHSDRVVIVFVEGPKKTFPLPLSTGKRDTEILDTEHTPIIHNDPPAGPVTRTKRPA
jgi:hypothetical protein